MNATILSNDFTLSNHAVARSCKNLISRLGFQGLEILITETWLAHWLPLNKLNRRDYFGVVSRLRVSKNKTVDFQK